MARADIARLERFKRGEFAQAFAGLDERRRLEAAILAGGGVGERRGAADPHDEIGIVEMDRPFLAGADDDRRDASGFYFLHRAEKIVPGLDVIRLHAGLVEQLLVIEEADLAGVEGNADRLAVDLEGFDGGGALRARPWRGVGGNVAQETRLGLRAHDAAAPAINDARPLL